MFCSGCGHDVGTGPGCLPAVQPSGGAAGARLCPALSSFWQATPAKSGCSAFCGWFTPDSLCCFGLRRTGLRARVPLRAASAPGCTAPCRRMWFFPALSALCLDVSYRAGPFSAPSPDGACWSARNGDASSPSSPPFCASSGFPLALALGIATLIILIGARNWTLYEQLVKSRRSRAPGSAESAVHPVDGHLTLLSDRATVQLIQLSYNRSMTFPANRMRRMRRS